MKTPRNSLRTLPSIESLMGEPALEEALARLPRALVLEAAREEVQAERERMRRGAKERPSPAEIAARAVERASASAELQLRRVLNATGIVLHTNLGRAPLADAARTAVAEVARGYSSLEIELDSGKRGHRGAGIERWLTRLTGAEAALAVNNGAGAVLLALSALAAGRAAVVSRGELIEIGGSFRIPEILEKSGARLIEVGTTNRTHLRDYERVLAKDDVAAILRVHPSNFRIAGFTARPLASELAVLAHKHRVPLIEDLGSGALVELEPLGLEREPTVRESLEAGADVVAFSGDKLLGGSQAGLLLGAEKWIARLKQDPLARALRLDKLALAALEATLALYADPIRAAREVPARAMLSATLEELEMRIQRGAGEAGGGALPHRELAGWVVECRHPRHDANALQERARAAHPPVLGIIRAGALRLDPRTLSDAEIEECATALRGVWSGN